MDPLADEPGPRWPQIVAFVASAALAAAILRLTWARPLLVAALLGGATAFVLSRWFARRKMRHVLRSGDVFSVLQQWSASLTKIPHSDTMAPLMTATAFAAYGRVSEARAALAAAARGPAWEAALEHRLFLDALLLTFEGDRDAALSQARLLQSLPLPRTTPQLQDRVRTLRVAVLALARAFAHQSRPGDREVLEAASETSPLVFWAMRYAAAVVAIDQRDFPRVRGLLADAPAWPAESTFRAFHDEILQQLPAR